MNTVIDIARKAEVTADTVRHYVDIGLLKPSRNPKTCQTGTPFVILSSQWVIYPKPKPQIRASWVARGQASR